MTLNYVFTAFTLLITLLFPFSSTAQTTMAESMASVKPAKGLTEVSIEYKLDLLAT